MAKDDVTLKNESLRIAEDPDCMRLPADARQMLPASLNNVSSVDFQKKFTFSKHEMLDSNSSGSSLGSALSQTTTWYVLIEVRTFLGPSQLEHS